MFVGWVDMCGGFGGLALVLSRRMGIQFDALG